MLLRPVRVCSSAMDAALYLAVLLLFATWSTVHVLLCFRLGSKSVGRGLLALIFPPLAPYWGLNAQIRQLPAAWVLSAAIYFVALLASLVGDSHKHASQDNRPQPDFIPIMSAHAEFSRAA